MIKLFSQNGSSILTAVTDHSTDTMRVTPLACVCACAHTHTHTNNALMSCRICHILRLVGYPIIQNSHTYTQYHECTHMYRYIKAC